MGDRNRRNARYAGNRFLNLDSCISILAKEEDKGEINRRITTSTVNKRMVWVYLVLMII